MTTWNSWCVPVRNIIFRELNITMLKNLSVSFNDNPSINKQIIAFVHELFGHTSYVHLTTCPSVGPSVNTFMWRDYSKGSWHIGFIFSIYARYYKRKTHIVCQPDCISQSEVISIILNYLIFHVLVSNSTNMLDSLRGRHQYLSAHLHQSFRMY